MFFRFATSFIAILALGQVAMAALTPAQVVVNIKLVATISGNTNTALGSLSFSTSPAQVKSIGTTLVNNFQLIIQNVKDDVTAMNQTPPFDDDEAEDVVEALMTFIQIHQILLSTVIGKQSIFAQFGVTAPVAAVLRSLEAVVDSFAVSLVLLIPTRKTTVQDGAGQLGGTLTSAEQKYEQICVPTPFYPVVKPLCVGITL